MHWHTSVPSNAISLHMAMGRLVSNGYSSATSYPLMGSYVAPVRKSLLGVFRSLAHSSATCSSNVHMDDGLRDFSLDGTKLTSLAHSTWRQVVKVGDTVIDATCGNGHDTLMLAKLVCGEGHQGLVYGFDLQQCALDNTSLLLDQELNVVQREHVRLLRMCHSKISEVIKSDAHVSLVAFNLGYLPGADKSITTRTGTTVEALKSAIKVVRPGGVISIIAYVGHPGGREEYQAVRDFSVNLSTESWACSHHELLNRPVSPHLLLLLRK